VIGLMSVLAILWSVVMLAYFGVRGGQPLWPFYRGRPQGVSDRDFEKYRRELL
jgi:hypothetical protein